MHPAFSVIFLTTLIGAAQGLFIAMVTAQTYTMFGFEISNAEIFYSYGGMVALVLFGLGLIASFFHLGRPERFWRTIFMWRTSWLSREVIALPFAMLFTFLYTVVHFMGYDSVAMVVGGVNISLSYLLGLLGVVSMIALFICTGMIYACIKFIQEWSSPWTIINYTLFGLSSGFSIAAALAAFFSNEMIFIYVTLALSFLILVAFTRFASLWRNKNLKPISTAATAIGVRHSKIKQISQGAMGGSFNTREYFHGKSISFVKLVKLSFIVLVFIIPAFLLFMNIDETYSSVILIASAIIQYIGLLAERWFFFAQANHPQNIYYQDT